MKFRAALIFSLVLFVFVCVSIKGELQQGTNLLAQERSNIIMTPKEAISQSLYFLCHFVTPPFWSIKTIPNAANSSLIRSLSA